MSSDHGRVFSIEFFPPKTDEGRENWRHALQALARMEPAFYSVTFGAGGSTREGTFDTIKAIQSTGAEGAPHISCIGANRDGMLALLNAYKAIGVKRLVALRGDLPSGMVERGDFRYASDLVGFVRAQTGDEFNIEVAAYPEYHPESPTVAKDLENFKRKVDAGANSALTQYFYNPDSYFSFLEKSQKLGISIPIVPGIMPITNYKQLVRFSDGCGAEIPRWIRKRLEDLQDDLPSLREFGLDVVTNLCEKLLAGGAPGLHFYTLNRAEPTLAIWDRLRV